MQTKGYKFLTIISLLLGAGTVFMYLPYTLTAFDVNCDKWFETTIEMFKNDYFNTLIYFGIALLSLVIIFNIVSIIKRPNIAKTCFKLSVVVALVLPLLCVMAFNVGDWKWAYDFWVDNIAKNIKTYAYIALGISGGLFILGLARNFTADIKVNFHYIFKSLMMITLLVLMIYAFGWCEWNVDAKVLLKVSGLLVGWLAIYFPLSAIILLIYDVRNK